MNHGQVGVSEVVKYFGDDDLEARKEKRPGVLVLMPEDLLARLTAIALEESAHLAALAETEGKKARAVSRNALILRMLRKAVEDYDREAATKTPSVAAGQQQHHKTKR